VEDPASVTAVAVSVYSVPLAATNPFSPRASVWATVELPVMKKLATTTS
jgi:hypothetical protein